MWRKVGSSVASGAGLFLLADAGAALAATSPARLCHKTCDEGAPRHRCWVEQFAVAISEKIAAAHIRFDIQQSDKPDVIVIAPLGIALIEGLTAALKSLAN
jgi:hypothetical protein